MWTGDFGNGYIERNRLTQEGLRYGATGFSRLLGGLSIESILEVGSNIGLNLHFIRAALGQDVRLFAVEPNKQAYSTLTSPDGPDLEQAWNCSGFELPLGEEGVDLAFTAGVLIHVAPDDLGAMTDEIVRVARRYVLCVEYFSHTPQEIEYRNEKVLLFKRDFGAFYLDRYPMLRPVQNGFLWQRELPVFDNLNWWLFEK